MELPVRMNIVPTSTYHYGTNREPVLSQTVPTSPVHWLQAAAWLSCLHLMAALPVGLSRLSLARLAPTAKSWMDE